ncbi:uncharacterized protein LOC113562887 [Ooceraea biroi]|uniref:uncharacterized protein LOC113562887 n=1 Tax=Ooceraea biroi TaxID=2015173 RepID=UPI000F08A990|nr:uncharacterized protein LOC113562887 [Ooceraea biroi]
MKVFEIVLNDMNYDEQSENEMIRPADLRDLKLVAEDEDRYKPLHSHVKYYNEQNKENKKQFPNAFPYLRPRVEEIFNSEQEDKPFIAGFKHELDKVSVTIA